MVDVPIDVAALWDAEAYWQRGHCPWTIFAYPANLADTQRLPRDAAARQFLAELQRHGLRVGIWSHSETADTMYFACPYEDREAVQKAIGLVEQSPASGPDFLRGHCDHLFSIAPQTLD